MTKSVWSLMIASAVAIAVATCALATPAEAQDARSSRHSGAVRDRGLVTLGLALPPLALDADAVRQAPSPASPGPDVGLLLSGAAAGLVGVVGLTVALASYLSPEQAIVGSDGSILDYTRTDQTASALWLSLGIAGLASGIVLLVFAYMTPQQGTAARRFDGTVRF